MNIPNRNDPCPCGSGKKYKQCCIKRGEALAASKRAESASIARSVQTALEHHQAGRLPQAEAIYQQILQAEPNHPGALHFLGVIAHQVGKNEVAVELIGNALLFKPNYAEAHNNMGRALQEQGEVDEAIKHFRLAFSLQPGYADAHYNLGNALKDQCKFDEAINHYRKALSHNPDFAEAHNNLGRALQEQGNLSEAAKHFQKMLSIKPGVADAHNNLGAVLQAQGKFGEAVGHYHRALTLQPDHVRAHNNLGLVLREQGNLSEAVMHYRKALSCKPDFDEALHNLGVVLQAQGKLDEAIRHYQEMLSNKPNFAEARSSLLFLLAYHGLTDPHEYLAQARNWEQACVPEPERRAARNRTFQRMPLAGRRLRVGYVSGDYRQHAASYFIEQLFTHHDRARIELFAYSTHGQRDAITERLQALTEHWVPLAGISDSAMRDRIEADGIDVLLDLTGHTNYSKLGRMGVFARRAAPVQAHYLGYFASTGLTEMDYWIGDETLTPVETDSHFSERVWRLPRVWVSYDGKADAPVPGWQPGQDGTVWLGSFNNLGKLTPATLALWAKLLTALPDGNLLLKTRELGDMGNRQRILDALSGYGISPGRIELQDSSATPDWYAHMACYDRLDIALDPTGAVGGGTTTCDALWMGVPVVTLEGDRMASRMTASMLNAIGHPEWIARSETEYIDKVVALARDVEQRKLLRSNQRNRMAGSPLCDARGLARSLENAYLEMFERWLGKKN